ncbi:MAG TPA: DNA cytosine methyltransferase [Candidatus Sulfotelmatobacter sp.]|nr:DNA cytosine methyltransferase [Candidatus Sulfotelmatobacter sp.]
MKKIIKSNNFKFIDLFAGIGGMRIAFEKAGGECVFSSDNDKFCQITYKHFFKDDIYGDITLKETKKLIPEGFNILLAGFPCQPFSSIGKRQGFRHATQGTLFHDIIEILKTHQPEAILLENVAGLINHDKGDTYKIIKENLDKLSNTTGYWIIDKVINASEYGVPQHRKRIYIVGFRKDLVKAKNPESAFQELNFSFDNIKKERIKFINPHLEKGVNDRPITTHLQNVYISKKDDGRPQILLHDGSQISNTLVASYHKIQRLTGIFVKDGPTGLRLLTENECRAIMGYPKISKKFPKVPVSRTQMYRQFGNSVAVPVVEKIAREMYKTLKNINSLNEQFNI